MYCLKHDGSTYSEVSCDTPDALVVVTRVELATHSPFYLDNVSALEIAGASLMVMAVAFVLRQIRKYLESEREES